MTTSYAVVGASRGIGLEYVRQLAGRPDTVVFAIVRNAKGSTHLAAAIANLKNVHVVEADIVDHASLERAAEEVAAVTGGKLDFLIHNAARMSGDTVFFGFDHYPSMDALDADFIEAFKINALGVVHSVTAFLPLLRAAPTKKIIVISTHGAVPAVVYSADIADMCAYGTTKAAGALATAKWALQLKGEGFTVVSLTPGLVDTTDTIGPSGDAEGKEMLRKIAEGTTAFVLETPEQSVRAQLQVIDRLTPADNGAFLDHHGAK
ncbi:NAD-P-binding protein [Trametes versicolor FP-101664 SS1]|uniref:NAD-P-binding protein n=1 Tax=Trametes versicolor (strain FP-101664) TaxID=717944 RepID=UPI0004623574|nr:NAD-P-binding protein [Trametes versicolor FP-101664 SS1]EIW57033.1 NAD-P-binding protein [Trametes versicolor FP-101664 SS1]